MSDDEDSAVLLRMDTEVSLPRGKFPTLNLLYLPASGDCEAIGF